MNEKLTLIIALIGMVMSFLGPVVLVLIQSYRDRKKALVENAKTGAETEKLSVDLAKVLSGAALEMLGPLREDLQRYKNELAQVRIDAARVEFELRHQVQESRREFSDYLLAAEQRDKLQEARENQFLTRIADLEGQVERYKREIERERKEASKREGELRSRVEALERENELLRQPKAQA